MGRLQSVKFRGGDWDVEVDYDSGYDPETGSHEIEWHFYELTTKENAALKITDAEEQLVYEQLAQYDGGWQPEDYE